MTHFPQRPRVNWLLKPKPLPLFPPTHSNLPQLKKKKIGKKKEIFWLLPDNISFLQSHCTLSHLELNYAQIWPDFRSTNSRAGNLFLLIFGRGRSQEDTKIQSEKAEAALHAKAYARFLLTFSARSQQVLSTLHCPCTPRILAKSWCDSCQCQQSALHWSWWGRGQPPFTMYLAWFGFSSPSTEHFQW